MSKPRLVNLLDDFTLGGVTKNLAIFDSEEIRNIVETSVMQMDPEAGLAPQIDADIITLHFPPSWKGLTFLGSLRLRNPHARIIQVEHSYTRSWEANNVGNKWRFRTMFRFALRMVDQIVCVSHGQAQWLAETGAASQDAIAVIHPYSDNPGLRSLPFPDFDPHRPLRIGTYGRFQWVKGFDRLIDAWKAGALPHSELHIGGFGEEEQNLHNLAEGASEITFFGQINDVRDFLSQCDIVAVPSRWESFGLVASEAREAGRPILVSPVDGLPEQVGQAGLMVDFDDHKELRRLFAAQTHSDFANMARSGRDATVDCGRARKRQWARLLEQLLETQPQTQPLEVSPSRSSRKAIPMASKAGQVR